MVLAIEDPCTDCAAVKRRVVTIQSEEVFFKIKFQKKLFLCHLIERDSSNVLHFFYLWKKADNYIEDPCEIMFDYYSRQNLLSIDKPLCLLGFFGTRVPEIAVALSQFSGTSVVDLERQVEHHTGMRVQHFRRKYSESELLQKEYTCLSKALPSSSRPLIVFMRPQSFLHKPIQNLVLKRSHCIYLKQGIFIVFSQILTILEREEQYRDIEIPISDPKSIHHISQLMKEYEKSFSKAHRAIDIEQKHPFEIAQELFSEFSK